MTIETNLKIRKDKCDSCRFQKRRLDMIAPDVSEMVVFCGKKEQPRIDCDFFKEKRFILR